jgi:DNA polymerase-3 subunit delta'
MPEATTVWSDVVGQDSAVTALRRAAAAPVHAYLFVGPPGSTKAQAAKAFAAALLTGSDDPTTRDARLILAGEHPDVREVMRVGASISSDQAKEIVRQAALAPAEGDRKVLILHEFHLLDAAGAGRMLKTIEEPPPSTHFVVLADFVPNDLVTIASRCVRIEFSPIPPTVLVERLVAEGVDAERAAVAAVAAGGNVDRARLLVADDEFVARRDAFAGVPAALTGTGSAVVTTVADLLGRIEAAAAPLADRHERELTALEEREKQLGTRGSGRAMIEARHKRELRRHRTDELRSGLGVIAGVYRDALVADTAPHPDSVIDAVHRIHQAIEALDNNPNETLLLQSLLWSLPPLS